MAHKVFYIIDTLEVGGAEQSLLLLAQTLDKTEIELIVCSLYQGAALRRDFEAAGVRVISLNLPGKYQFIKAFRQLRKVVGRENPAILHTTLFRADQVGRAVGRWLGIPVISSFVNISYDPSRTDGSSRIHRSKLGALRICDRITARWVAKFHALSGAVRDSNCRYLGVPKDRVVVVPRGRPINGPSMIAWPCRPQATRPGLQTKLAFRRELNLEEAFPIVFNVGRLVDQKGQNDLIEAMRSVADAHPQAKLLIAGDGPLRSALQQRIDDLSLHRHIILLGRRSDVDRLLEIADCFAFPSIYEGLPGSLLEAMLAGLPIVATDIPVIREVIDDGITGLLTPSRDAAALAGSILRIAGDRALAKRIGREAKITARRRYDIRSISAATVRFYKDVIDCNAHSSGGVLRSSLEL